MDYLSVKDVAALVRRNEETIRRMIRARKLDVKLDNNNRHQGYQIPVDELTRTWAITREDVDRYVAARRLQQQAEEGEHRLPLGPERERAKDGDPPKECTHEGASLQESAPPMGDEWDWRYIGETVERALEQGAQRVAEEMERMAEGARRAWDAACAQPDEQGGSEDMAGDKRGEERGSNQRDTAWEIDFSGASERIGEIFSDAYRQIRGAVERASNGERDWFWERTGDASSRARSTLERLHSDIRQSIERDADGGFEAYAPEQDIDKDVDMDEQVPDEYVNAPIMPNKAGRAPEPQPVREEPQAPCDVNFDSFDSAAPEPSGDELDIELERRAVGQALMDEDDNASYQMLQQARRAVMQRMKANQGSAPVEEQPQPEQEDVPAEEQPEQEDLPVEQQVADEPKPEVGVEGAVLPGMQDDDEIQARISDIKRQLASLTDQLSELTRRLMDDK